MNHFGTRILEETCRDMSLEQLGRMSSMDFPKFKQGHSSYVGLCSHIPYISIYSSHIHNLVEHCITSVFSISKTALRRRDRAGDVALARQIAMYLTHVAFGLTLSEVGRIFLRDRTTVAHACAAIEDLRDDPSFDRALFALENALIRLPAKSHEDRRLNSFVR